MSFEPVLDAIMFEHSSTDVLNKLAFRDSLIHTIRHISYLKMLNDRENLELSFTAGFQDLIYFTGQNIDFDQYLDRVLSKSPNCVINDKSILISKIDQIIDENLDFLQLTNGHDLLNTFAKYFREVENKNGMSGESLASSIRMIFNKDYFEQTRLFSELENWQIENSTRLF